MLNLDPSSFAKAIPTNKEPEIWRGYAAEYFELYQINTNNRIAGFLAQTSHESADFTRFIESTNYSWDRLVEVFGRRYFPTDAFAKEFNRDAKRIANYVYSDHTPARKSKLGNTEPNDGWNFRGSGLIQLTGRSNVSAFASSVEMNPEEAAAYCRTKRGAIHSACWFWSSRNINKFADAGDIIGMSKAVNGGDIGLADRKSRWARNKNLSFLAGEYPTVSKGAKGELVKRIQKALGFSDRDADGIYGNQTLSAIRAWQKANKYIVTGVLYPDQLKLMFGE